MKIALKILGGLLLVLVVLFTLVYLFGTADLRTETAKANSNEAKAQSLMQDMAKAHNIQYWDSIATYSVSFADEFYGLIGHFSHPFAEDKNQFSLSYIPKSYDGALNFSSGKNKGQTWGIQSWKTYTLAADQSAQFQKDNNIFFWLPTYQYFIEFPKRIQQANALAYAGQTTIDGKICEGILASWNTTAPQRDIDQYLIWIDNSTKRIVKLEYTIREMYNFLTGAAYFKEYKDYDGFILPSLLPVKSNLVRNGFLHEMSIHGFTKNPVALKKLRPDSALPAMGDEK